MTTCFRLFCFLVLLGATAGEVQARKPKLSTSVTPIKLPTVVQGTITVTGAAVVAGLPVSGTLTVKGSGQVGK